MADIGILGAPEGRGPNRSPLTALAQFHGPARHHAGAPHDVAAIIHWPGIRHSDRGLSLPVRR